MIGTDLAGYAADLAEAIGVSVEIDARDLVLPGVLLTPGTLAFDRLSSAAASMDVELLLIAGDTNTVTALDELTDLFLKLRRHLGDQPKDAEPFTVQLPSQSTTPLPALRCSIPLQFDLKEKTQ